MEDFTSKITEILNNPDIMKQIKDIAGGNPAENTENNQKQKIDDQNIDKDMNQEQDGLSPDMLSTVMKLAPLLSSINTDDKYSSFLRSLRPLLSETRQKKLDESEKIIKLIKIFPILKSNGII